MSANALQRKAAGGQVDGSCGSHTDSVRDAADRARVVVSTGSDRSVVQAARLGLTLREWQVLERTAESLSNRAIANRLGIAVGTVKLHLTHAYAKLKVTRRSQAVALVRRLSLDDGNDLDPEGSWELWFPHSAGIARLRRGDVLFNRAEPGDRLYLIENGEIELQGIGSRVRAGTILGEIAVLTPARVRTDTAVCASDVELRYLTREQARHYYFTRPDFGYRLLHLITRRLMADRERAR